MQGFAKGAGAKGAGWAAITLLFGTVALLASAPGAFACSCVGSGPVCQAYWKTDAVFDATVEGIAAASREEDIGGRPFTFPEKIVHLKIRQAWKGVAAGPLDVWTAADGAACGYGFQVGKRYLVFAWKRPVDGRWSVSLCSSTREYDGTGEGAAFLASLSTASKGARVFGSIKTMERRFDGGPTFAERPVETRVRLLGDGQERTVTSTGGTFEFTGLASGAYRLIPEMPDGFTWPMRGERTIELPDDRACAQADYYLAPSGRITGRVVDAAGRPLRQISIEADLADAPARPGSVSLPSAYPDDQGGFEIRELPPGRYIVGINLENRPPSQYSPYARTIYPSDGGGAIITIDRGQMFDLGEWRLPPTVPTVRLDGTVVWEDGRPVAGAVVAAFDITDRPGGRGVIAASATSGQDGRFTIELRQRRVYTFLLSNNDGRRQPVDPPRVDTASSPPAPIRLVIQRNPR